MSGRVRLWGSMSTCSELVLYYAESFNAFLDCGRLVDVASISPWSGEFLAAEQERAFRHLRAPRDQFHIRVIWALSILFFVAFGLPDYREFGKVDSYTQLLAVRTGIVLLGGLVVSLTYISRFQSYADWTTLMAFLMVSVCYAVLSELRGGVERNLPGALLLVIGIYLFSPNRFAFNLTGGICCSLGLVIASYASNPGGLAWLEGYAYLFPANLLAILSLVRLNTSHRRQYLQSLALAQEVQDRKRAESQLAVAHRETRDLLHNILPQAVVADLRRGKPRQTARQYEDATVLFADLVGFTELADSLDPAEVLDMLDLVFTRFDLLAESAGLEKIKTVGDAYMAVGGVPLSCEDHLDRAAQLALTMHEHIALLSSQIGRPLSLRVGLQSGPLVAGVIGRKRFAYDVWGHTVNLASRLEGVARPGETMITSDTATRLARRYEIGEPEDVALKGVGRVSVRLLIGRSHCSQGIDDSCNSVLDSTPGGGYGDIGVNFV